MKDRRFSKILLIDNNEDKARAAKKALIKQQYQVECLHFHRLSLLKQVNELSPDLIVLKIESLPNNLIQSLYQLTDFNPKPIVMYSPLEDLSSIKKAIKAGVSAYNVGEIESENIENVIDVAIVRFLEEQRIKSELEQTQLLLSNQRKMEKAKVWLMENNQISEDDAYHHMRKIAMGEGTRIESVAENILAKIGDFKP